MSTISIVTNGAFRHPYDQVPLDHRYRENLDTEMLPTKVIADVSAPTKITLPPDVRFLLVKNLTGQNLGTYPTEEQREQIMRCLLYVSLGDPDPTRACVLYPAIPDDRPFGTHQVFWLAPGVEAWWWAPDGVTVKGLSLAI